MIRDLPSCLLLGCAVLAVPGCESTPPGPEPLRPVRTEIVAATTSQRARTFSGLARAGLETDLSFRVSGRVDTVPVHVGDRVDAGALLARLERADFDIAVRQAEASLEQMLAASRNADSALGRVRGLWENNNAAQNELDQSLAQAQAARAQAESARQSLAQARRKLEYTHLRAPVDGFVAEVRVEVNENVQQGQTVVRMTSGSEPEVEVAIPENFISGIESGDPVTIAVSALPDMEFEGVVTEVGIAATAAATTFPVRVRLRGSGSRVRSGMAADVTFHFDHGDGAPRIYLPAYAVGEDRHGRFVFVLEDGEQPDVGVVRRVPVETGAELTAEGSLRLLSGLAEGQRVVTAGVRRLADGQRVRMLDKSPGG